MTELNKVLLIGRLTKDPELKYTSSGTAVTELRLASNHTYKVNNEKREEVCFVDVTLWGRSAETVKEYMSKGREILIEGRLQFEQWESQDGQKRSKHRIVADRFQFIGSGGREQRPQQAEEPGIDEYSSAPQATQTPQAPPGQSQEQEVEDDLPF